MDSEKDRMRLQLCKLIEDWNGNRLDLFALSQPNEELEFHGVMRFFFQESGQKVATKCIRVSSTATTRAVIDALIEKFHADLRMMLSTPQYSLWEVHENGEERQLRADEKPLLVQLNWHKDDREGRFLLRRGAGGAENNNNNTSSKGLESTTTPKQINRKLSKREKKEQKKKKDKRAVREAEDLQASSGGNLPGGGGPGNLYAQVPPTTFTRTISNPEIVMKKRREKKLAEKLKNIGEGGSLKIYGEEVSGGSKPYVTLLVSVHDRTTRILREALEKYGIDYQRDGDGYYLAEVRSPLVDDDDDHQQPEQEEEQHGPGQPQTERALDDDDCPLLIYAHDTNRANITFHVRRKTPAVAREAEARRKSKTSLSDAAALSMNNMDQQQQQNKIVAPFLIELNPDGSESGRRHVIHPNVTEVGNDRNLVAPYGFPLHGPYVHPRHCVLAYMEGVVTATPCGPGADLRVDERPIAETTVLRPGQTIRIGQTHHFRFLDQQHAPQAQQHCLKRTPSEQGMMTTMVRSISTPTSSVATTTTCTNRASPPPREGGGSQGRFATTFDVDGHVETVVIPFVDQQQGNCALLSLTPTPLNPVSEGQPVDHHQQQHYNSSITSRPAIQQQQQQFSSSTSALAAAPQQHRRTPPVLPTRPGAGGSSFVGRDAIPAIIELVDNAEDDFLGTITRDTKADQVHFKLAPAYVIYMCCRYRVSPHYRTSVTNEERARRLAEFLAKCVSRLHVTIQDHCHESTPLAFWMANCSELLNFAKLDVDLNPGTSPEPQESMADAVQKAYDHLVAYFKQELHSVMPAVLDLNTTDHEATSPCVHMLSGAMSTLRHCRVNAALTIQIFSQLFHYVNMYLFNWLVSREGGPYCTGRWGAALRRRLADVQAWAEKQGLEAAAECRLQTILQTAQLLQMQKTPDNFVPLCTSTSKLNSLQIRSILERYVPEMGEGPIDRNVLENLIKVSEEQVDDALRSDGRPVQLEEELDLQLPFLLPDDGYSAHVVRGIPNGLRDFLDPFLQRSICRMILQPWSSGVWTVHMTTGGGGGGEERRSQVGGYQSPTFAAAAPPPARSGSISSVSAVAPPPGGPEVAHITLHKGDGGIGLSIIQAQGIGHTQSGIYVKNVVPGSCAARDGRLEAGDQLLKVNGQSLVGISQEVAAKIMGASGPTVHLEVAKRAVLYDGLATVVYQQSPDAVRRGSSNNTPDPITAGNRVRSVEHLHHHQRNHHQPQHQQLGSAVEPGHQHQRYPSSGNVHYYQQPRTKTGAGPPPVQYHHKQQYHHQARSMSASNLKEDEPQPMIMTQQQQHQEEYYQNLAQYQTNPTSSRRMSASDYGYQHYQNQLNQNQNQGQGQSQSQQQMVPHQRQHSTGALVSSSYASNQEYHRLPALQQSNQQVEQFAVHRAVPWNPANRSATPTGQQHRPPSTTTGQQQTSLRQRLGQEAAALAASAERNTWRTVEEEERERQVQAEVERLMLEEVSRLECKDHLTDEDQRRYRALKFELEYRRRLQHSLNQDEDAPYQQQEQQRNFSERNTTQVVSSVSPPNQRQRMREQYFQEAEQQYLQVAIKERQAKEGQQQVPRSEMDHSIRQIPEPTNKNHEANAEVARSHIDELQAKLLNMATGAATEDQESKVKTNGYQHQHHEQKSLSPPPPPSSFAEAPHKVTARKVVAFNDTPAEHGGGGQSSSPPPPMAPPPVPPPPMKYVYDEAPEDQQPRARVIGAQEVYRDPRQERLKNLQQRKSQQPAETEKLSFRDKMRLFAAEIGESSPPKDRVKSSSAQREIEKPRNGGGGQFE